MGAETIRKKADELIGQLKEKIGELTSNGDLHAEGSFERSRAQGKHEHPKDHVCDPVPDIRRGPS